MRTLLGSESGSEYMCDPDKTPNKLLLALRGVGVHSAKLLIFHIYGY